MGKSESKDEVCEGSGICGIEEAFLDLEKNMPSDIARLEVTGAIIYGVQRSIYYYVIGAALLRFMVETLQDFRYAVIFDRSKDNNVDTVKKNMLN
ncbi:hypothetical protein C5167_009463 [Papaver somniferum]|uniref:Uncharacterized protein n=1 Tax=Papaver somniferum TaxID=3469 RepID=A0A4Y7JXG3_PAPSO|nr:hypothetical protein C5167_009463 [Papaver somniferum]